MSKKLVTKRKILLVIYGYLHCSYQFNLQVVYNTSFYNRSWQQQQGSQEIGSLKTWRRPQRKCERGKKDDRGRERRETKRRLSKRLKWKNKRKPSGRGKESWRNRPSKPQERTANKKTELVSDGTSDDGHMPRV